LPLPVLLVLPALPLLLLVRPSVLSGGCSSDDVCVDLAGLLLWFLASAAACLAL